MEQSREAGDRRRGLGAGCERVGHCAASSLLFRWREQFAGEERSASDPGPSFVPVTLPIAAATPQQSVCTVEIVLRNGRRVRVRASIDPAALKRIVDVLEDR
jgi:hypothetical protein